MFVRVYRDTSGKRLRWRVKVVHNYRVDGKGTQKKLLREIGSTYDDASRERLRAERELHQLVLSEAAAQ